MSLVNTQDGPSFSRPRVAAGLLVQDSSGKILLVKPTYKDGWDIPGGYVESGESPVQACRREVREELGLAIDPGRLLIADWAPRAGEGDKLLLIFDGGVWKESDPSPTPDGDEIGEAVFWSMGAVRELTPERLGRRLLLALEAVSSGQPVYAEGGVALART